MVALGTDPTWIKDGEKYALIGLNVKIASDFGRSDISDESLVLTRRAFDLPDHWREWLGTIKIEDVESCNLFLIAKTNSDVPGVLDGENRELQLRVDHWFMGLVLERSFSPFGEPFCATGSRIHGEIDVRSFTSIDPPARTIVADHRPITKNQIERAARIGQRLGVLVQYRGNADCRLLRCLEIYRKARNDKNTLDRIHQFTRCLEGLILAEQGKTKRQFKRRTELFVGPSFHDFMDELYAIRSDVEHLHEYKHLEAGDRETRVRLAQVEAVAEFIARSCLSKIILDPSLVAHFESVGALTDFWSEPLQELRAQWGSPIDPHSPIDGFDFEHVRDEELGLR